MREELLRLLRPITEEEQGVLREGGEKGENAIHRELYTTGEEFIVDSGRMLEEGQLIDFRLHTRFAHFPRHRHNYVEMVYMCQGTTTHLLDGERIVLEEGDILFLHQSTYHEILPASQGDIGVNFMILPPFFHRAMAMLAQGNVLRDFLLSVLSGAYTPIPYLLFHAKGILPVENLIENLLWILMQKQPRDNILGATSMGLLFLHLTAGVQPSQLDLAGSFEHQQVFACLRYVEDHYSSGTLEEVAGLLGMPGYQVSRLLKKVTGSNFKQLLGQRKLQQAAHLLSNTTMDTAGVMAEVGYENSSYFHRKFREKFGCSPREYRLRYGLGQREKRGRS